MSTHEIAIVEIQDVRQHPNADKMELTDVWGWQCCIGKGQFKSGDRAIYVPPDYEVPVSHPLFSFLAGNREHERIKVRRFRGQISQGLLVSVPGDMSHLPVGTNVIELLGARKYEPPVPHDTSGMFIGGPSGLYSPKFDVESYQRYRHLMVEGEPVVVTEKIHGANARFVYAKNSDGEWMQFCGSRNNWLAEDESNIWWQAFRSHPSIGEWCRSHPEDILFGEVFGQVQDLKYGAGKNDVFFAAFAVLSKQSWVNYAEMAGSLCVYGVPMTPLVYRGPLTPEVFAMAESNSRWNEANHLAEGVVIVPEKERVDPEIGRVCLKLVSNRYLER